MRGLLVVGAGHDADERSAAAAVATALSRSGGSPASVAAVALGAGAREVAGALHAHAAAASPVTAARHEGAAIDPGGLVTRLRSAADGGRPVVISVAGGLLAPLTPRYAVRDLARELGLPLLLAVRADAGAVNLARLSVESARGAGLAVAAVALTGWPDPPSRVQLDERALLADVARVPVVTLDGRHWPAAEWIGTAAPRRTPAAARPAAAAPAPAPAAPAAAAPAAAAPAAAAPAPGPSPGSATAGPAAPAPGPAAAGPAAPAAVPASPRSATAAVALDPYTAWHPTPTGDPRTTPRPRIMDAVLDIVAAEGPMRASRAYALYNRAAGGKKLTTIARAPLSSAVYWLAREGRLALTRSEDIPWQDDDLIRTPDGAPVHVRELGPRTLEEVPLDEIAELMRRLRTARGIGEPAALKRAVLDAYGLVRLTTRADEYLALALGLLD
jgi:hypothetical protein